MGGVRDTLSVAEVTWLDPGARTGTHRDATFDCFISFLSSPVRYDWLLW